MTFWRIPSRRISGLREAWNRQLDAEGFDAEVLIDGDWHLRETASHCFHKHNEWQEVDVRDAKAAYFRLLGAWVSNAKFRTAIDRTIMEWHADGWLPKEIGDGLKAMGFVRCRNTIMFTIRRYEHQWGIREYSRKELNRRPVAS